MLIIRILIYILTVMVLAFVLLSPVFPVLGREPLAAVLITGVPLFAVYLGMKHRS